MELLAGSFTKCQIHAAMRNSARNVDRVSSPDGVTESLPSAVAKGEDSPFIRMLRSMKAGGTTFLPTEAPGLPETGVPGRSALKGARPTQRKGPVRINPAASSPTPGTLRPLKKKDPKVIVSWAEGRFLFPPK